MPGEVPCDQDGRVRAEPACEPDEQPDDVAPPGTSIPQHLRRMPPGRAGRLRRNVGLQPRHANPPLHESVRGPQPVLESRMGVDAVLRDRFPDRCVALKERERRVILHAGEVGPVLDRAARAIEQPHHRRGPGLRQAFERGQVSPLDREVAVGGAGLHRVRCEPGPRDTRTGVPRRRPVEAVGAGRPRGEREELSPPRDEASLTDRPPEVDHGARWEVGEPCLDLRAEDLVLDPPQPGSRQLPDRAVRGHRMAPPGDDSLHRGLVLEGHHVRLRGEYLDAPVHRDVAPSVPGRFARVVPYVHLVTQHKPVPDPPSRIGRERRLLGRDRRGPGLWRAGSGCARDRGRGEAAGERSACGGHGPPRAAELTGTRPTRALE
jgi:hypothetical protein